MSIDISYGLAISMVLVASFMWGSWMQVVKHLDDYPFDAFVLNVFIVSVVFVWSVMLAVYGVEGWQTIVGTAQQNPAAVWVTLACGFLYVMGMSINLSVMAKAGLVLSTSVSSSTSIIIGTLVSIVVGGLAPGVSLPLLVVGGVVLLLAVIVCVRSIQVRDKDLSESPVAGGRDESMPVLKAVGWALVAALFVPAYPLAMSVGLRSPFHPDALPSLCFMAVLSLGAFLGVLATSGVRLVRRGQLKLWAKTPVKYWALAGVSAICHYGGNMINSLASPVIGVAIAWPMGTSYNMWTYIWGLAYGEFRGASRKAYALLFTGIGLFVSGVAVLTVALY